MKEKVLHVLRTRMPVVFTVVASILILTAVTEIIAGVVTVLKTQKTILGVILGSMFYNKIKEFISAKIK